MKMAEEYSCFKIQIDKYRLFNALIQKNKEKFEKFLKSEDDINHVYKQESKTCLDYACSNKEMSEYVELLLKHNADINKYNEPHMRAPIHFAAENGDVETVNLLIRNKEIKLDLMAEGYTALHLAIKEIKELDDIEDRDKIENYEDIVKLLVEAGTNVNIPDMKCMTSIHSAAEQGFENIVKLILDSKNPVDLETYKDSDEKTAKMLLEEKFPHLLQHPKIILLEETDPDLMQNRKLVSTSDTINMYKLFYHLYRGEEQQFIDDLNKISQEDALKSMLIENNGKYTFIQFACKNGLEEVVKMLLDKGADPNLTAPGKRIKPLAYACRGGYYKILELLEANEEIEFNPMKDRSLLQITVKGKEKIVENANVDYKKCLQILLKSKKACLDINYKDVIGNTALHYAIKSGDQDIIMELLRNRACLGIKNKFGEPPLLYILPKTLESYLDSCQMSNGKCINSEKYEIRFDYSFLKPLINEGNTYSSDVNFLSKNDTLVPETDVLLYMSKNPNLKSLLKHPVITSFLYMKWKRISFMFNWNLVLYILFWFLLNLYILLVTEELVSDISNFVLKIFAIIGTIFLTIRETIQILVSPNKYWRSIENWLELILIVNCYMIFFNNYFEKQQLHAIAILLSSAELVLHIGHFPRYSVNILMLKTVSWNFFKFLLWYSILIIAFALSFHILFKVVYMETKDEFDESKLYNMNRTDKEDENNLFSNLGTSLFKTMIMLTGEFDSSGINFKQSVVSYFIFIVFVFMIPIVLFNLLNGLAVSDTQAIKDSAKLVSITSQIELISYFEGIILGSRKYCRKSATNAQNRFWLRCKMPRLIWLAERICLFPEYLPMAQISVKVNQSFKINILVPDTSINIKHKYVKKILMMDTQIMNSARTIMTKKVDDGKNDRRVYVKLEELTKQIRDLSNIINSLPKL